MAEVNIDPAKLDQFIRDATIALKLREENKIAFFKPYPKQLAFIEATAKHREVLLMAGNQVGKTEIGAYATTCHLTGQYPPNWKGPKWTRPTRGWIAGETSEIVRDVQQKKLCGEPGVESAVGTGMIPKDCLVSTTLARGIADAYDTIQVRHVSGGVSLGKFKSYVQGRTKFQAETLDWGWCDEEPPEDIYGEFLARLTGKGRMFITFTPLKGRSKVVLRFIDEASPDRAIITMSLDEAMHFTEEERKQRVAGYAIHERDARAKGLPILGSGAVFQFGQQLISEAIIRDIPPQWFKLWGIDFGIDHPFGAALAAIDRDNDCIHIINAFRMVGGAARDHAEAIKTIAANVPVAWPHDGHQRDKGSGEELAAIYRRNGLSMLADHATFDTGGYSPEACVMEIEDRAKSGRFKVASHLSDFWSEFALYHRKDGNIVRTEDDIISAVFKIVMAKRFARQVPLGSKVVKRRSGQIADGVEREHWGMDA